MAVTIKEVALAAGVSTAAVSKVLHGRGQSVRVSDSRADEIRRVAEELNYRPNVLARNLRTQRTHTVGLIFENFGSFTSGPLYYMHLLDGVGSVLFRNHYRLTILPELAQDDILGSLGDGQLEGVVWCKLARDPKMLQIIHNCPIPIVALNAPVAGDETEAIFVGLDNVGGVELALDHLLQLGHRRIAFLHEVQELTAPDRIERTAAFRAGMQARGLPITDADILCTDWEIQEFADYWKQTDPQVRHTAVIAWSERAAGQLLLRAAELGIDVPGELSVVGFDSTAYCETTSPRLTAVRQPITEMASCAAETLIQLIQGVRPPHSSITFPCGLDARDSTAPPPQR